MKIKRICTAVCAAFMMLYSSCFTYAQVPRVFEAKPIDYSEIVFNQFNVVECYSSGYSNIEYSYTDMVSVGNLRYISQLTRSKYFNSNYWGRWDGNTSIKCANGSWYGGPSQECLTSCISMALSYIGVNKTPEDILEFGGGVTISNTGWGGATYMKSSFYEAYDRYASGEGCYSPPIIHLDNYSSGGHYVLVIGKSSDNVYQILDPARDTVWDMIINESTVSYTMGNGSSKQDTLSSARQYYLKDAVVVKPFLSFIDEPVASTTYNNEVKVRGWAIYGNGITKVCGSVNGNVFEIPFVNRLDVSSAYLGYPTGNEGFSGFIPPEYLKNGENILEITAYSDLKEFTIGKVSFNYVNEVSPEIKNVEVNYDSDGYTVSCEVSDDYAVAKVLFPTWTLYNGQDDLPANWQNSEAVQGELNEGRVSFRVNRSDHNNETGRYITHIYAYDIHGNYTMHPIEQYFDDMAPVVSNLKTEAVDGQFNINCNITDNTQIESIKYETYIYSDGIYELYSEGSMEENTDDANKYETAFEIDKEKGSCYYRTVIYVYDIYGNYTKAPHVVLVNPDEEINSDYELPSEGSCGNNLTYSISEDYVLTIRGEGEMPDWPDDKLRPWYGLKNHIKEVTIEEGVSSIGANAFKDFINLNSISFSLTVSRVGESAFNGAFSLEEMVLPKTINVLEADIFANCPLLNNVSVLGKTTEIIGDAFPEKITITGYANTPIEVYAKENAYEFTSLSGQLNNDGVVNAADALIILKHAALLEKISNEILIDAADINADLKIDAADALLVLKKAANIID